MISEKKEETMLQKEMISCKVEKNIEEYIRIRRLFHEIPELGFEEKETTDTICQILRDIGVTPMRLEPTGVVAYIGPKNGYTLGLRADIDGLPIMEETGLSYQSRHPGKMHACGHDGHIAGLLGAAFLLKEMERELSVRVKLIFQPSEENTKGAAHIISQGAVEDVDAIFGLHLFSDLPTGMISIEAGPRMAQTDRFSIRFLGNGGHAGKPHQCVDATVMAADFVISAQTIISREIDPLQGAVITIGSLHSGSQYNIISGEALVEGTCRSFDENVARHLKAAIESRAKHIAGCYGGKVELDYDYGAHPPVQNDAAMAGNVARMAEELLGRRLSHVPPLMLGEDFSWYQQKIPGVFAFVGCHDPKDKECFPNHHPRFSIDENALSDAVLLHLAAVMAAERK
ncbi:MAG: amidohydrolase [Clostridiales bacterium]|nr:amidohydrolase [Clostridiales bacterium]